MRAMSTRSVKKVSKQKKNLYTKVFLNFSTRFKSNRLDLKVDELPTDELSDDVLTDKRICLCAPSDSFCVAYNESKPIVHIWRYLAGVDDANFMEAMGFEVFHFI